MPSNYTSIWAQNSIYAPFQIITNTKEEQPMSAKTEHLILADGRIVRRTISEGEINIVDEVLQNMTSDTVIKIPKIGTAKELGQWGVAYKKNTCAVSLQLTKLPMHAPYRLINGFMVPVFTSDRDELLTLEWTPPAGMRLVFMLWTAIGVNKSNGEAYHSLSNTYLYAIDPDGAYYRLPLPNLYDDARVCLGSSVPATGTLQELLQNTYGTLVGSPWGSDLWKAVDPTQALFRWKSVDKQFVCVVPDGPWQRHCIKISNDITKNWVI